MKNDQDKRNEQFGDWNFDDVFAASEEDQQSPKELKKEAEKQPVQNSESIKEEPAKELPQPSREEDPELQEFSDTKRHSFNRLKPEIKLTSVEESIREDNRYAVEEEDAQELYAQEDAYDEAYYDEDEYAYEDEYDEDGYEYDEAYDDEEYEYDDDAYDEEYDYEEGTYDEDGYAYEDEYDYEESDEKEEVVKASSGKPQKKNQKPVIIGAISAGVLLLLILAIILLFSGLGSGSNESSAMQDLQQLTGVVTGVDQTNETILIYNAESGQEQGFSLKDAGRNVLSLGSINVGDVVQLQYNRADANKVEALNISGSAEQLKNIKNAIPTQKAVTINGKTYSIDDKLVCLYGGQPFDVKKISENTTYDAIAVGEHIYTIHVTYATGTLVLQNLQEYAGGTLILQPAVGDKIEKIITPTMEPIELQEGSVEVQIKMEDEIVYTGKIFISAGKENTLKLTGREDQKGKVVFISDIETRMTIQIDGKEYYGDQEIELEYGDYTAHISAAGYDSVDQSFTVSQPYQQINVEFKENTTQVTVSTNLWGVSLYVDGVYQGELEDSSITCRLSPGTYTITCTRTGYHDKSTTITITEGMEDQMLYFSGFVPIESNEPSSEPQESSEASEPVESSEEPDPGSQEDPGDVDNSTPEDGE